MGWFGTILGVIAVAIAMWNGTSSFLIAASCLTVASVIVDYGCFRAALRAARRRLDYNGQFVEDDLEQVPSAMRKLALAAALATLGMAIAATVRLFTASAA